MPENTLDRLKSSLAAVIKAFGTNRLDYFAFYAAKVISQSGNNVDLQPDDTRLPGFANVPLRLGLPGAVVTVNPGSRVLLGWAQGDPQRPIATVWESSSVVELKLNATTIVLNDGLFPVARATQDTAGPYPIRGGNSTVKA